MVKIKNNINNGYKIEYTNNAILKESDKFDIGVDHFKGIKDNGQDKFPHLLIGKTAIAEFITNSISDKNEFVKTKNKIKAYMGKIHASWNGDDNFHDKDDEKGAEQYAFGPADQYVYNGAEKLNERRAAFPKSFDSKVQVNFGIDPHWMFNLFEDIHTNSDADSPLPKNKKELKDLEEKELQEDNWQADLVDAIETAKERVNVIINTNNSIGKGDGLKSIFIFWAFYLLRGSRNLIPSASEKNIPKFLLKASFQDLFNRGLSASERALLDTKVKQEYELKEIMKMCGVIKNMDDNLFVTKNSK